MSQTKSGIFNQWLQIVVDKHVFQMLIEAHALHTNSKGQVTYEGELVARIDMSTINSKGEKILKQFKCLTPNGTYSRLYLIPKKIVRRHVEGKTPKTTVQVT